jgi:hypothetical protein
MKPAVLILYGPFEEHPWRENMLHRRDKMQKELGVFGFGLDVAMAAQAPTGRDEIPEIRVAEDPVFDQKTGHLLEAHFQPGKLDDYPCIIDHWAVNFQAEVKQPAGTFQKTAYGVGLPPGRLWNHKNIQEFGNRKDLMDGIISAGGVAIPTYRVLDYQVFAEKHGSSIEVIYKPQGGARGIGVEVFNNLKELYEAIRLKRVPSNGFIQPYLRNNKPIQGVKPLTNRDAALLENYNVTDDRPREIRMHVITTTDGNGKLQTEAYPMMKISEPHRKYLKIQFGIGIDPVSIGPGSFIHDKSVALAQAVCRAASTDDQSITHYYGVFDWLVDGDVNNPEDVFVVDGNCRIPGLLECALPARAAFQQALAWSSKRAMTLQ